MLYMSDKTKLYVFEKKEIALIFVFMLLIATTSFMLGVKIGKSYSYEAAGLTEEDRERIDLLSTQEELIQQMLQEEDLGPIDEDELNREMHETLRERIREQLERRGTEDSQSSAPSRDQAPAPDMSPDESEDIIGRYQDGQLDIRPVDQGRESSDSVGERRASHYSGKFTIQLGSYRRQSDAEDFARGFAVRGYEPIINEVDIPNRGTWFRVSLGVFDTSTQAKRYIENERELFQGQDYVIGRFD